MQAPLPDDPANWPVYDRLSSHVRTLLGQPGFRSHEAETFRALLVRVIRYLEVSRQGWIGARIAGAVHGEWETHLGEDHPDSLALANRLAACHYGERDFGEARIQWVGLLSRFRKVFGPEHADTLTVTSNLALALGGDGELAAAEKFARAALVTSREKLGDEHIVTRRAQRVVQYLGVLRENAELFAEVSSVLKSGSGNNYNEDDYAVRDHDTWVTVNLTKQLYNPNEPERRRLQAIAEQIDAKLLAAGFALTHVSDHAEGVPDLLTSGLTGLAVIRKPR
ncbi:tetratricopeptide repeat protein [Amycolatopsis sp. lyj-346]|uniref:tetratricopeptide repeat protein n=1 Tax=Amycolatopsis sp. lyj-346 TaxID=2789289 RepID=UPI00397CD3BC